MSTAGKLSVLALSLGAAVISSIPCHAEQNASAWILFSSIDPATRHRRLVRISADGTERENLIQLTNYDGYPHYSAQGARVAFYGKYDDNKTWSIHSAGLDGSKPRRLTDAGNTWDSSPAWSADGARIIFSREYWDADDRWHEEIWTMRADGTQQERLGDLEGGGASFLADGRILYHSKTGPSDICIAGADGRETSRLTDNTHEDIYPRLSPDGQRIAFMSDRDGNREIYVMNVDGSDQTRLTYNDVEDWNPSWSADGTQLVFASGNTAGLYDIYIMNDDGSAITKLAENGIQPSWIHD